MEQIRIKEFFGCLLLWLVFFFFHIIHATVAEFDKFEAFVEDLVVLVRFREVHLDECYKGFSCLDILTEGALNQVVVLFCSCDYWEILLKRVILP